MRHSSAVCLFVLLGLGAIGGAAAIRGHSRSLQAFPQPLPAPFAFPKDVANTARSSRGSPDALATQMCNAFGNKLLQGSKEFRDNDGSRIFAMALNMARAAYVYPDTAADLGAVIAKCDEMGGSAAEGLGYGIAFVFAKGSLEAAGMTAALEAAYDKSGSCRTVDSVLDVAAAVIKARDVALDELHLTIATYSPKLAPCTPKDAQQQFRATSGDVGMVRSKKAGGGVQVDAGAAKAPREAPAAPAPAPAPAKKKGPKDPKGLLLLDHIIPNFDLVLEAGHAKGAHAGH